MFFLFFQESKAKLGCVAPDDHFFFFSFNLKSHKSSKANIYGVGLAGGGGGVGIYFVGSVTALSAS